MALGVTTDRGCQSPINWWRSFDGTLTRGTRCEAIARGMGHLDRMRELEASPTSAGIASLALREIASYWAATAMEPDRISVAHLRPGARDSRPQAPRYCHGHRLHHPGLRCQWLAGSALTITSERGFSRRNTLLAEDKGPGSSGWCGRWVSSGAEQRSATLARCVLEAVAHAFVGETRRPCPGDPHSGGDI
jgi:hypothetical protein